MHSTSALRPCVVAATFPPKQMAFHNITARKSLRRQLDSIICETHTPGYLRLLEFTTNIGGRAVYLNYAGIRLIFC